MLSSSLPPVEELMSYLRYLCLPDSIKETQSKLHKI
jgi:hypothetical protein